MAPVEAKHTSSASARADLLVQLCGRNAFISFDRLFESEIGCLARPGAVQTAVLSEDGDWFPEMDDAVSPIGATDIARAIDTAGKESGLNRPQRRALKRQRSKLNRSKTLMHELLEQQAGAADLTDLIRLYPMRPEDAKVLSRYFFGQASKRDAEHAFFESLRDPRWMMRWFAAHHDRLTPFTQWLRAPSRVMAANMREVAAAASDAHRLNSILGDTFQIESLTISGWRALQDSLLLNLANRFQEQLHPGTPAITEVGLVVERCPGISSMVRSLYSALWDSVGRNPRTLKESDFVDAVHAMYAPYVSFFRADTYMSAHIQKQVTRWGTQIVSRLEDLPGRIQDKLDKQN
jgi:hypothetical protein